MPVNLNEVFKLFHDEKVVREAAFAAICKAVDRGPLAAPSRQLFFNTRSFFENFEQLRPAHDPGHAHQPPTVAGTVCPGPGENSNPILGPEGATFLNPQRVDVLRKPA